MKAQAHYSLEAAGYRVEARKGGKLRALLTLVGTLSVGIRDNRSSRMWLVGTTLACDFNQCLFTTTKMGCAHGW